MVSRSHDQNPADDRRADQTCGCSVRNRGRPNPCVQPEPGCGRTDGGEAPAGGAEPGGPGGPGRHEAVGGLVPGKGVRGDGVRRQERRRDKAVCRCCQDASCGQAARLCGKGAEPGGPGDDFGRAQRGQVHLYQQDRRPQDCQNRGPARCHPGQAVGAHRPRAGTAGYPRHSVAQV